MSLEMSLCNLSSNHQCRAHSCGADCMNVKLLYRIYFTTCLHLYILLSSRRPCTTVCPHFRPSGRVVCFACSSAPEQRNTYLLHHDNRVLIGPMKARSQLAVPLSNTPLIFICVIIQFSLAGGLVIHYGVLSCCFARWSVCLQGD